MDDVFVAQIMSSPVTTVSAETPAKDAAALMLEEGISSVVVVDDANHVTGILTSTDFVAIAADEQPADSFSVADYMTDDVVTTAASESIQSVADLLIEYGIHHIPVSDESAGVIGMVTTTDLTAYLSGMAETPAIDT